MLEIKHNKRMLADWFYAALQTSHKCGRYAYRQTSSYELMTKFDVLIKVYRELITEFKSNESDLIFQLVVSWETSLKQIDEFINSKQVKKSQVTSGLEQGLREIPGVLDDLPESIKKDALRKFHNVVGANIPDLL